MAISKEQWAAIEKELSGLFGRVSLTLDGRELLLKKEFYKENRLCIVVYIDGQYSFAWGDESSDKFDPFTHRVWWEKKIALYKPKEKARIQKALGKRRAKQAFPNIDATTSYWLPFFQSFRTLKGKLNKEKALELVSTGYQPTPTPTPSETPTA